MSKRRVPRFNALVNSFFSLSALTQALPGVGYPLREGLLALILLSMGGSHAFSLA